MQIIEATFISILLIKNSIILIPLYIDDDDAVDWIHAHTQVVHAMLATHMQIIFSIFDSINQV
jgi:hypothetical protein